MKPEAYILGGKYVSISLTGKSCDLMCKFCRGKYLRHMLHVYDPHQLYTLIRKLYREGVRGFLLSGGFTKEGKLPFKAYLNVVREVKREFEVIFSIHPGLVNRDEARMLRKYGIDVVDFELTLDNYVIRDLMNLRSKSREDFEKSFEILVSEGPPYVAPHIGIGFNPSSLDKVMEAVDFVKAYDPYLIIFLIFIPDGGNKPDVKLPFHDSEILNIFMKARYMLKNRIALGCMRPLYYKMKLDDELIDRELIDRVAMPLLKTLRKHHLQSINACCSLPDEYRHLFI